MPPSKTSRRSKDADKEQTSTASSEVADATQVPTLSLYGGRPQGFTAVTQASLHLQFGMGYIGENGDKPVVLPYVQTNFFGSDDVNSEAELQYSKLLTFDNAAFLIDRLADDFAEISQQLEGVVGGRIPPEPARLNYAQARLENAATQINVALKAIRKIDERMKAPSLKRSA